MSPTETTLFSYLNCKFFNIGFEDRDNKWLIQSDWVQWLEILGMKGVDVDLILVDGVSQKIS